MDRSFYFTKEKIHSILEGEDDNEVHPFFSIHEREHENKSVIPKFSFSCAEKWDGTRHARKVWRSGWVVKGEEMKNRSMNIIKANTFWLPSSIGARKGKDNWRKVKVEKPEARHVKRQEFPLLGQTRPDLTIIGKGDKICTSVHSRYLAGRWYWALNKESIGHNLQGQIGGYNIIKD